MLNSELETLNLKQTQMSLPTGRQARHEIQNRSSRSQDYLLSFVFSICLGVRV
jgi:hypothetical protein